MTADLLIRTSNLLKWIVDSTSMRSTELTIPVDRGAVSSTIPTRLFDVLKIPFDEQGMPSDRRQIRVDFLKI